MMIATVKGDFLIATIPPKQRHMKQNRNPHSVAKLGPPPVNPIAADHEQHPQCPPFSLILVRLQHGRNVPERVTAKPSTGRSAPPGKERYNLDVC
jgi:hypothetical protein